MRENQWLDVEAHLRNANYPRSVLLKRLLWSAGKILFRLTPRPLYGLRNALLRCFGARIGKQVKIYPSVDIFYPWNLEIGDWVIVGWKVSLYSLGQISIGNHVIISQGAHLCAGSHDISKSNLPLTTPPISIHDQVWICADSFVGPGVTIQSGAILGARSVTFSSIPKSSIVIGNPAKFLKTRI